METVRSGQTRPTTILGSGAQCACLLREISPRKRGRALGSRGFKLCSVQDGAQAPELTISPKRGRGLNHQDRIAATERVLDGFPGIRVRNPLAVHYKEVLVPAGDAGQIADPLAIIGASQRSGVPSIE